MKKLLIVSLVVVVVGISALTACGPKLTENDIATIQGLISRVDALESQVASLKSTVSNINPSTAEENITQLQADLDAIKLELDGILPADGNTTLDSLAALIAGLEARIVALEASGSGGGGEPPSSGEVTVVLDVDADPLQFMSGPTAASQFFPVKITNGTAKYRQVTYNITLRCVSVDKTADVVGGYSLTVNGVPMGATPVPSDTGCQWIYFLWIDSGSVPVAPGKTITVYTMLNNFATSSGIEVWEVTLSGVNVSDL